MVKSLKTLRRENKMLLEKSNAKKILADKKKREILERQKLEAENRALRNPGSTQAKATAKSLGFRAGKLLIKGLSSSNCH